jgi:D-alanine--poly(phosphoribitol) ligase subunit 2
MIEKQFIEYVEKYYQAMPPEKWLQNWFAARGATVARDQNYFDSNAIDSFGVIEMIEEIEDHFKLKFRQHDFQDRRFATVAGLAEIINERLQQV